MSNITWFLKSFSRHALLAIGSLMCISSITSLSIPALASPQTAVAKMEQFSVPGKHMAFRLPSNKAMQVL